MSSNEYGYVGTIPEQSFKNNSGVFLPENINDLTKNNKWTSYGQLELIQTQTVSSVGYADFTDIKANIYDIHFYTITNVKTSNDNVFLWNRLYEQGTLQSGSVHAYAFQIMRSDNTGALGQSNSSTVFGGTESIGNVGGEVSNCYFYFSNLGNNTTFSFFQQHTNSINGSGLMQSSIGGGALKQSSLISGIRTLISAGTFSATISLYGIRYS